MEVGDERKREKLRGLFFPFAEVGDKNETKELSLIRNGSM
jgi:hypothetical protein